MQRCERCDQPWAGVQVGKKWFCRECASIRLKYLIEKQELKKCLDIDPSFRHMVLCDYNEKINKLKG